MGIHDGIQRDETKRDGKDYYRTPEICVEALVEKWLLPHYPKTTSFLDPCKGDGVIGKVLRSYGYNNVVEFDKYPMDGSYPVDFLEYDGGTFDVITQNVPYSLKDAFLDKAMKTARDVYSIFPNQVESYNQFHRDYMDVPHFIGKLSMRPKFFMTEEKYKGVDGPFKRGGISQYRWFHHTTNFQLHSDRSFEEYVDLMGMWKEKQG